MPTEAKHKPPDAGPALSHPGERVTALCTLSRTVIFECVLVHPRGGAHRACSPGLYNQVQDAQVT